MRAIDSASFVACFCEFVMNSSLLSKQPDLPYRRHLAVAWMSLQLMCRVCGFWQYFQQLMYVNVQPMAPVFGADHSIPQSDTAQAAYAMYGPLFRVLRGSTWKLESGAVTLDNQQARFNVFETVNSTIVAIVLAPNVSHVNVGLNGVTNTSSCAVLQPAQALRTNSLISASGLILVQLRRGCALLICARDD